MKVMTIVGTRPELIKLSRVIAELDKCFEHVLVHTGQNYDYELNEIFFQELEIRRPDHFLETVGENLGATLGNIIERSFAIMQAEAPEALLLLGDTNSCLSVICAKRLKIPVFHMEAGNRCFDERVPEELNRRIVDHCSDINLPYTSHARDYLVAEGVAPQTVIKTGSPMREVLAHYAPGIERSTVLPRLGLARGEYFLVSFHREENADREDRLAELLATLETLAARYGYPVIVSTHPRTRNRLEKLGIETADARVRFLAAMGFFDYVQLQKNAFCVLSDSGTLTEESSLLGFAAVTLREAHERPEGMDEATLVMAGLAADKVVAAIEMVTRQRDAEQGWRVVADYQAPNVSLKVARLIASYVDYVNRTVWRR